MALQIPAYYLALSNGHTKTNVLLGVFTLVFMIPSIYYFTKRWGLNATAIPFLLLNVIALFYLNIRLLNKFFKEERFRWVGYALIPVISSFVILLLGSAFSSYLFDSRPIKLVFILLFCAFAFLLQSILLVKFQPSVTKVGLFKSVKIFK